MTLQVGRTCHLSSWQQLPYASWQPLWFRQSRLEYGGSWNVRLWCNHVSPTDSQFPWKAERCKYSMYEVREQQRSIWADYLQWLTPGSIIEFPTHAWFNCNIYNFFPWRSAFDSMLYVGSRPWVGNYPFRNMTSDWKHQGYWHSDPKIHPSIIAFDFMKRLELYPICLLAGSGSTGICFKTWNSPCFTSYNHVSNKLSKNNPTPFASGTICGSHYIRISWEEWW